MIQLTIVALFGILAFLLLDGDWKSGLIMTIIIGFVQDPIRKLMPGQPSWVVGLALISFTLSSLVLYSKTRGRFNVKVIFSKCPQLGVLLPIFFYLLFFQFLNSLARFSDPTKAAIGAAFYLAPLAAVWAGFNVGLHDRFLKKLLYLYLSLSTIYGISVFIGWQGNENIILSEVGQGIQIIFRHGFHDHGAPGFWRTSEIAAWQLATAASLSVVIAIGSKGSFNKIILLMLAVGFGFLTILTGRRKGLAMVIVFVGTYLILLSKRSSSTRIESLAFSAIGVSGLSFITFSTIISPMLGWRFGEYWHRATSIAGDETTDRFRFQGIGALFRAIEVSDGIGYGLGAGSQTGNLSVASTHRLVRSAGYISEGGGGRLVLELGIPGLIIISIALILLALLISKIYVDLLYLPPQIADVRIGLLALLLSNIPFFFSAAQVYSDPFVLIMMSICFGAYLSVPQLANYFIKLQEHRKYIDQYCLQDTAYSSNGI